MKDRFPFRFISVFITFVIVSALYAGVSQPSVEFVTPSIVRIQWHPDGTLKDNNTGVCIYDSRHVNVSVSENAGVRKYVTEDLVVEHSLATGALSFIDGKTGVLLMSEDMTVPRTHQPVVEETVVYDDLTAKQIDTANGMVTVKDVVGRDTVGVTDKFTENFIFSKNEALYGLGSHMEGYMNLQGKTQYLTQHNLKVTVPVIVSTRGYGLLFDVGCAMKYVSMPVESGYRATVEMEAADEIDYYFIKGEAMQDVVAGYRYLTGAVSLMPRYLFGYIQSKERYNSSRDIISTLEEFRRRHIPVDMIVQDWNYWPEGWGYMKMDSRYYPSPENLADSVHALNARIMVSIWPNPQYCPQENDFRSRGYMLKNSIYDAFNPDARKYYWDYADREFFSNGFDAWWCDSSEPLDGDWNTMPEAVDGRPYSADDHERRWMLNKEILGTTLGLRRSSLFSLYHSRGIYENQRAVSSEKRVVNLTRSGYAGQQRYGTVVWNGDVSASWDSFRRQIPSGLNYMATGNPYWTIDVGGFFTGSDDRWFRKGEFPQGVADESFREYYVRMFEWAAFLPVLRSHGTDTPREPWQFGEPGTPFYDAIINLINLRYSLNPYIYSMAAAQSEGGYSMARPLSFDFPADTTVYDIGDQYMFGDFMVCPVTTPGEDSRKVYIPESENGTSWTDFWTGALIKDGGWIETAAPLGRLPVFVRSGSIVLTSAPVEYVAAQAGLPVNVHIYPGCDASFEYYDDAGDGYGYESGESVTIPMYWHEESKTFEIGRAKGSYPGMPVNRIMRVSCFGKEKEVVYDGQPLRIEM